MHCQFPCIAKHVLYSCLRTLKYRTLAHISFTNTIQTLWILKPLCHPAPGIAAATRPSSQITLGRLVIIIVVRSELIIIPTNTSATVGHNISLSCSTNLSSAIDWNKYTPDNRQIMVYTLEHINDEFQPRFTVHPAARGQYDLLVTNVQTSDAGVYECTDRAGLGEQVKIHLTVEQTPTNNQTTGILMQY